MVIPNGPSSPGGALRGVRVKARVSPWRKTSRMAGWSRLAVVARRMSSNPAISLSFNESTMSPGNTPTACAGEPAATSVTSTRFGSGAANFQAAEKASTPRARLATGPARSTTARVKTGDPARPPDTLGSSSPAGRTKPPRGKALTVNRVPAAVKRVKSRGGNPIPNSVTRTPRQRAATK